jgi:TonB family protein
MRIFYIPFLALVLTPLSQTTEKLTAVEQPGVPPAAERAYSERERIAICKKKGNAPLAPSEPQPLKVGGKVTRPTVLRNVKVHASPPIAGTVILQVVVDEDGCVRDPRILRGINRYQDSAALDAVRRWVFLPATLEGKPVSVNYVLRLSGDVIQRDAALGFTSLALVPPSPMALRVPISLLLGEPMRISTGSVLRDFWLC